MSDAAMDREIIEALAGTRPIVPLSHARQRTSGAVGVLWRESAVVAICAHRCELAQLPPELAELPALSRLDVGDNQLAELPRLPATLRELYVHDNQLAQLPVLPQLDVLDANRNRLTEVPALRGIGFAYLAANRLTALPETSGVRYLNVGDSALGTLAIADPAIEELRAESAGLDALVVDERARGSRLRELSLRGNRLAALPASVGSLAQLRTLDLRGNQLDELPDALLELPLEKLDLRWNPLRAAPSWLGPLTRRGCRVYV